MQTTNYKGFVVTLSDVDTNKLNKAWEGAQKHWRCIVYDKKNRRQMGFDIFGCGNATMTPLKALCGFITQATDYLMFSDAKDLMKDYGYDNYVYAKNVYDGLKYAYFKCRKFIGSDEDIREIEEELGEKWG